LNIKIAEVTGHPIIHLDNEFWKPGWIETPHEEWIEKQQKLVSAESGLLTEIMRLLESISSNEL